MYKSFRFIVLALFSVSVVSAAASADAYSDLAKTQKAFYALKSFRATLAPDNGPTIQMEFVAPDKWHELLPGGMEAIIVGSTMKRKVGGSWMSVPMAGKFSGMLQNLRGWAADKSLKTNYKITDLGMDGSLHKYQYVGQGADSTMWIRADHLPDHTVVKSQGRTMTITYKDYNAPITIGG